MTYNPNPNKQLIIQVQSQEYERIPIKTNLLHAKSDLIQELQLALCPYLEKEDLIIISEKAVACTQGRAILLDEIRPGVFAKWLSRYVSKSPHGIGLSMPETMEMAIQECGLLRILLASLVSMITKLFHLKGWFYRVAGIYAAAIDGPTPYTIPPYNHYVVLAPLHPTKTAQKLAHALDHPVFIVDVNDLGANILGASHPDINVKHICALLKDNPLGQTSEQTPVGIIRLKPSK